MIGKVNLFTGKSSDRYFYLLLAIFVLAYVPWFLLGDNSYVLIHDNLDSELVYLKLLSESEQLFDYSVSSVLPNMMNGLPRIALRSGINVTVLLFMIFPPIYAYILNHLLVHLIGFVGMYLLLRRYVNSKDSFIPLIVGVLFGLVSYYHTQYGLSISGQPMLLFSFLNILSKRDRWYDWLYICFFPFYSFLVVTLPFFLPLLIILWLWHAKKQGKYSSKFLLAVLLLVVINLAVEYPLLKGVLFEPTFISHREDWDSSIFIGAFSLKNSISNFIHGLLFTQYHAGRFFTLPILILLIFILAKTRKVTKNELFVLILIILIGLWSSFNDWFIHQYQNEFKWIKIVTIDRFFFLSPFLWLLLLGLLLKRIEWNHLFQRCLIIGSLGVLFLSILYFNTEFILNTKLLLTGNIKEPTFKQFYANDLFDEIITHIKRRPVDYRVVSVGMHPSIAQYNGLYTLDSYQNNYPLAYKYQFREIIAPELEKDQLIKEYFDSWGSRVYVFQEQLGKSFMYGKNSTIVLDEFDLNYDKLKKMGGRYIISALPINDEDAPIILENTYESQNSFWKLYLYRVDN